MTTPRIGIDIGGSGTKGAIVDIDSGEMLTERVRLATPPTFGVDEIVETVAEVVEATGSDAAVGVGFPAVVRRGIVESAPTALSFEGWIGVDLAALLSARLVRDVTVGNDADAAGIAEIGLGAAHEVPGVVVVLTLGTGIGSGLFVDGVLVPNTEFGKLHLPGQEQNAELHVASRVRDEEGLSWAEWAGRLQEYLEMIDSLFTPDLVVLGGGVSKKPEKFIDRVSIRCPVLPAAMGNHAGIIGAALFTR